MSQIYAFTCAAKNYLPKVAVLADSLRKFHPEIVFVLGLSDSLDCDERSLLGRAFDILTLDDLGIDESGKWAYCHNIVELSTAIKPFVLQRILDRPDCSAVLYFDPDMAIFSRLDELVEMLGHSSIILTPHLACPEAPVDAGVPNEISCLRHGIYNLGFFGVSNSSVGLSFARWWADRLYDFCRDDKSSGFFTDQKWVDLVPAIFDRVAVVRNARFNVASWNVAQRAVDCDCDGVYFVNGEPLGFYHFTGYDSGAHRRAISLLSDNSALQTLLDWYGEALSHKKCLVSGCGWGLGRYSNGAVVKESHRVLYRSFSFLRSRYPDPYRTGSVGLTGFLGWCRLFGWVFFVFSRRRGSGWRLGDAFVPTLGFRGRRIGPLGFVGVVRVVWEFRRHPLHFLKLLCDAVRKHGLLGVLGKVFGFS